MLTRQDSSIFGGYGYNGEATDELGTLIAVIDESEPYEVDMAEIWKTKDGSYAYLTASGCSCWDGDFKRTDYNTKELLALALIQGETQWNPSLRGSLELLKQVFEND